MVNFASMLGFSVAFGYTLFFFHVGASQIGWQQFFLALFAITTLLLNILGLHLLAKHWILLFVCLDILVITFSMGRSSLTHLYLLPGCVLVWMILPVERRWTAIFYTALITSSFLLCEFTMQEFGLLSNQDSSALAAARYSCVVGAFGSVGAMLYVFASVVRRAEQQLQELAHTDVMTGAKNRRHFEKRLQRDFSQHQEGHESVSLVMLDIDHFKRVNDTWGHDVGDEVIRQVASTVQEHLRWEDEFARIGGEEFCILLADTEKQSATQIAERLRSSVEEMSIDLDDDTCVQVTISLGVTEMRVDDPSVHEALKRADQALYRAKQQGRNQVQVQCKEPTPSMLLTAAVA
jgi:diguanylate cyclase (GGDEF)-like protein